jgi:hypothetical protein
LAWISITVGGGPLLSERQATHSTWLKPASWMQSLRLSISSVSL